jgi:sirohydrochlorin ferrochelatase
MDKLAELVRAQLGTVSAINTPTLGVRALSPQKNQFLQLPDADTIAESALSKRDVVSPKDIARSHIASVVVNSAWYPLVGTATLELAPLPLHEQIRQFASDALAAGCNQLQLLPLFLLSGVHVMEDIPKEVALALGSLGQSIVINQRSHIGAHPGLGRMLASQLVTEEVDARILLSHGSRRPGSNEAVEAVAEQLGAVVAYWSVKPTLEEQLLVLADAGHKQIAILPYFLFSGGITDAIAQKVVDLQKQFPGLQLSLAQPIGASAQLANLIVDLMDHK